MFMLIFGSVDDMFSQFHSEVDISRILFPMLRLKSLGNPDGMCMY